jgi:hypothetical protein
VRSRSSTGVSPLGATVQPGLFSRVDEPLERARERLHP